MNLHCPNCLHRWHEKLELPMNLLAAELPMNLLAAVARLEAMSVCVKCGQKGVLVDCTAQEKLDVQPGEIVKREGWQ